MLLNTYEKLIKLFQDHQGYRTAAQLKEAGVTTVQIKELVDKGVVERVAHGNYWLVDEENGKPEYYQMIEVCMVNPRAVICADSACYFHGLIDTEPEKLSIATLKTDRSKMQMHFPVTRHYYSDLAYEEDMQTVNMPAGTIHVYGLERSVCDAIRFRADVGENEVSVIVSRYMERKNKQLDRLYAYADAMRVGKIVRTRLEAEK
ncbi:MAG: type IV toxin-antitoxin system AbiEi family antitoxin domain-containing protein [Clostridiaceae bacterium]|nr:type IV toxin-antitoxin system AbiEi family antitoxin domain-containing protein [Clostridiaceae bacterium]